MYKLDQFLKIENRIGQVKLVLCSYYDQISQYGFSFYG